MTGAVRERLTLYRTPRRLQRVVLHGVVAVIFLMTCLLAPEISHAGKPVSCKTIQAHQRWVLSLSISPNGKWLASGSDDNTLKLWNLQTGAPVQLGAGAANEPVKTLRRFKSAVTAVAFSPSGKSIAVGTHDGGLELCDALSGKTRLKLAGHDEAITTVLFDPTGKYLATGSADDTLIVWDASDAANLLTLHQGNEYDVKTAAFSPDGKHIVTGDGERELKLWDAGTGDVIETLTGHTATVTSAAYSPDGKRIVSASWDRTLRLWDAKSGKLVKTIQAHKADISAVLFSADGSQLVSASEDKTVRLWDARTGKPSSTLGGHRDSILCIAISRNGRYLASGSNKVIRIWKLMQ